MAIQRSAASEIRVLIDELSAADAIVRDAAVVRLSVIGARAVPHLLDALESLTSPIARAAVIRALEGSGDRRGVPLAIDILHASSTDPKVASAAVRLLGSHLDAAESDRALDALTALVLDPAYPEVLRLDALTELERMPPAVIAPIRKWLAADPDPGVRHAAASRAADRAGSTADPDTNLELAASGQPADPVAVTAWVRASASVSLSTLHKLIEVARAQEEAAPAEADRNEWRAARGAAHLGLARRDSRVAIYDVREMLARDPLHVPADFVEAIGLVGDATCLEPLVAAVASSPIDLEDPGHVLHDALVAAARTIVRREGLARRHAVVRKILKQWPDAGPAILE